jgi:hypothetical protein
VLLLAAVAAAVVSVLGVVAHYGSDQFDQVPASELTTVGWFYAHVAAPATVFTVCTNLPWRYRGAAAYRYESLATDLYSHPASAVHQMATAGMPSYFIATPSQALCGVDDLGLPEHWLSSLESGLRHSAETRVVYDRHGAEILEIFPSTTDRRGGGR